MPNETVASPNTNTAAPVVDNAAPAVDSKVASQDTKEAPSILDTAVDTQKQTEEKRLLDSKTEDLSDEDKVKQAELLKANEAKVAKAVPEKYEVKVPDGFSKDMSLLNALTPAFKEIGITNEQAQKIADAYMPFFKEKEAEGRKMVQAEQEQNFKAFTESEKKNTLEKLGSKATETLAFVAKFRDAHLSKTTQEFLNASGLANNYDFIQDMAKFGRLISEDRLVDGKTRGMTQQKTDGEVLYGSPETNKQ